MGRDRPTEGFVVRLQFVAGGKWITVQRLQTGEMREFASWEACVRYFESIERVPDRRPA